MEVLLDVYSDPLYDGWPRLLFLLLLLFKPQLLDTICKDILIDILNDPFSVKIHLTGQLCHYVFIHVNRFRVFNTHAILRKTYWV